MNAIQYVKNVGKSLGYSTWEAAKDLNPAIKSLIDTNKETAEEVYKTAKDYKTFTEKIKTQITSSTYWQVGKEGLLNAWEDLKHGTFYNKERKTRVSEEIINASMSNEFDDFGDIEDFDLEGDNEWDLDENFDELENTVDIVGEKVTSGVAKATIMSAQIISENNTHIAKQQTKLLQGMFTQVNSGLASINSTVSQLIPIGEALNTHIQNSSVFYTTITDNSNKQLQLLQQLTDHVVGNRKEERYRNSNTITDVIDSEGMVDIAKYASVIVENIKDSLSSITMMGDIFGSESTEGNALRELVSSPFEYILTHFAKGLVTSSAKSTIKDFNKILNGFFSSWQMKLNSSDESAFEKLRDIFALRSPFKTDINTGDYEKGRVPFDGVTRKAITEVIPTYLSKILAAITNKDEIIYDYKNGAFTNIRNILEDRSSILTNEANSASFDLKYDLEEYLDRNYADNQNLRKDVMEVLQNFAQNSLNSAKLYNPRTYDDSLITDNLREGLGEAAGILQDFLRSLLSGGIKSGSLLDFNRQIYNARANVTSRFEGAEKEGSSVFNSLYNNRFATDKETGELIINEYTRKGGSSNIFTNTVDEYNNNIFYYLRGIYRFTDSINETIVGRDNGNNTNPSDFIGPPLPPSTPPTPPPVPTIDDIISNNVNVNLPNWIMDMVNGGDYNGAKNAVRRLKSKNNITQSQYYEYLMIIKSAQQSNNANRNVTHSPTITPAIITPNHGSTEAIAESRARARRLADETYFKIREPERQAVREAEYHEFYTPEQYKDFIAPIIADSEMNKRYKKLVESFDGKDYTQIQEQSKKDDFMREIYNMRHDLALRQRNKDERGIFEKMRDSNNLPAMLKTAADGILEFVKTPARVVTDVVQAASITMTDMIYGNKDAKAPEEKGILGYAMSRIKDLFDNTYKWIQDNILTKMVDRLGINGPGDFFKRILSIWGVDLDTIGEDFAAIFDKSKNDEGDDAGPITKIGRKVISDIKGFPQWFKAGHEGTWNDIHRFISEEFAQANPVESFAYGGMPKRDGLAVVSEGELIIPKEMNPFYRPSKGNTTPTFFGSYADGGLTGKMQGLLEGIKSHVEGIKNNTDRIANSTDNIDANTNDGETEDTSNKRKKKRKSDNRMRTVFGKKMQDEASNVKDTVITSLFGGVREENGKKVYVKGLFSSKNGKEDDEKTNKGVSELVKSGLKEMRVPDNIAGMISGGIAGLGVSLVTGGIVGPLIGLAFGAGAGLITKSSKLQGILYGNDEKEGILSKEATEFIKTKLPSLFKGGLGGAVAGTLLTGGNPLGIIGGITVGVAAGAATKSKGVLDVLFGEKVDGKRDGRGLISPELQKRLKESVPAMAIGAGAGLLFGPFGLVGNILLGSALGFASKTNTFTDILFGKEKDGKREGGLIGWLKKNTTDPIIRATKALATNIVGAGKNIGRTFGRGIYYAIKHNLAIPLYDKIKDSPFIKLFNNTIGKPIAKLVKGVLELPGKGLNRLSSRIEKHNLQKGYTGGTAKERIAVRKKYGLQYTGYDVADRNIADMSVEDLEALRTELRNNNKLASKSDIHKAEMNMASNRNDTIRSIMRGSNGVEGLGAFHAKKIGQLLRAENYDQAERYAKTLFTRKRITRDQYDSVVAQINNLRGSEASSNLDKAREDYSSNLTELSRKLGIKITDRNIGKIIDLIDSDIKGKKRGEEEKTPEEKTFDITSKIADVVKDGVDSLHYIADILVSVFASDIPSDVSNFSNWRARRRDVSELGTAAQEGRYDAYDRAREAGEQTPSSPINARRAGERMSQESADAKAIKLAQRYKDVPIDQLSPTLRRYVERGNALLQEEDYRVETDTRRRDERSSRNPFRRTARTFREIFDRARAGRSESESESEDDQNPQAYSGGQVTKTGLIAVSEGELIIPSELNPFYHKPTNKAKQVRDEAKIVNKFFGSYAEGGTAGSVDSGSSDITALKLAIKNYKELMEGYKEVVINTNAVKISSGETNVDTEESSKTVKNKLKDAAKVHYRQSATGGMVKQRLNNQGELIDDTSDKETRDILQHEKDDRTLKQKMYDTVSNLGSGVSGLIGRLFGKDDDEDKPRTLMDVIKDGFSSIFDSEDGFFGKLKGFLGFGNGGFSNSGLMGLLKKAIPIGLLVAAFTGKLDSIGKMIGNISLFKGNDKASAFDNSTQTKITTNDGKTYTGSYDDNGNFVTSKGTIIDSSEIDATDKVGGNTSISKIIRKNTVTKTVLGQKSVATKTISKTFGKKVKGTVEDVAETSAEKAVSKGFTSSLMSNIAKGLEKIPKVMAKIPGLRKFADKADVLCTAIYTHLDDAVAKVAKSSFGKGVGKLASKMAKLLPAIRIATVVIKGIDAWGDAESILGITEEATFGQRAIASLLAIVNALVPVVGDLIPNKTLVNIFMSVAPKMGIDVSKLAAQRDRARQELDEWNATHEDEQYDSIEAYNDAMGKGGIIKKSKRAIKNGFRNIGKGFKSLGGKIKSTGAKVIETTAKTFEEAGTKVIDIVKLTKDITKKHNEYMKSGDISGLWSGLKNSDKDSGISGTITKIYSGLDAVMKTPTTLIMSIGHKLFDGIKNIFSSIKNDWSKTKSTMEEMERLANEGDVSGVINTRVSFDKKNLLSPIFNAVIGFNRAFNVIKAGIRNIVSGKFISDLMEKIPFLDKNKDTNKDTKETKESQSAGGTGFVSQKDPAYANKSLGTSTVGSMGCGPATAAMAVGGDMNEAIEMAKKYQTKNGTNIKYFEDYYKSKGKTAKYYSDKDDIASRIASGEKIVLMGQNGSNKNKSNSPFGPNNHYVLATGFDKDGNLIINDPESSKSRTVYDRSILNSVKMAIGAGGAESVLGDKAPTKDTSTVQQYINTMYDNDTARAVYGFLTKNGYSPVAASAVMGNLYAESGMNPSAIQKGSGIAAGIAQWENYRDKTSRWLNLNNYAESKGTQWTDLQTQLEFLLSETNSSDFAGRIAGRIAPSNLEKAGVSGIDVETWRSLSDPNALDDATKQFEAAFERAGKPNMPKRIGAAREYLKMYSGMDLSNVSFPDGSSIDSITPSSTGDTATGSTTRGSGGNIFTSLSDILTKMARSYFGDAISDLFGIGSSSDDDQTSDDIGETTRETGTGSSGSASFGNTNDGYSSGSSSFGNNAGYQFKSNLNPVELLRQKIGAFKYANRGSGLNRNPDVPNSDGSYSADCSSTIQWAFKKATGIDIGGNSDAQSRSNKLSIVWEDGGKSPDTLPAGLRPNDILFYNRGTGAKYGIGHVELYAGNGKSLNHGGGKDGTKMGPVEKDTTLKNLVQVSRLSENASAGASGLDFNNALNSATSSRSSNVIQFPTNRAGISKGVNTMSNRNAMQQAVSNATVALGNGGKDSSIIIGLIKTIVELLKAMNSNTTKIDTIATLLADYVKARGVEDANIRKENINGKTNSNPLLDSSSELDQATANLVNYIESLTAG